jgi:subtilisin family serine protease
MKWHLNEGGQILNFHTYKSNFLLAFIALFIVQLLFVPTGFAAEHKDRTKEVIVVYKDYQGVVATNKIAEEIRYQFQSINAVAAVLTEDEIAQLESNPHIAYVEENISFTLQDQIQPKLEVQNQPGILSASTQWNIEAVNASLAWEEGFTGKGVKVAVVDTGIAPHPQLEVAGGVSTLPNTTSWNDDNGHGTHVAGSIAAKRSHVGVVGVAPEAALFAVKALDRNGIGTLESIMKAIDWSITNQMDIINLSLGTNQDSYILKHTIDKAYEKGILIVGAAGNSGNQQGTGNSISSIAKYDSVIAVAAVDHNMKRAPFSSTGSQIEFSGPGVEILSTYLNEQYAVANGTSSAAPHLSGILALLKQKYPDQSNRELRKKLQDYTMDLGQTGRDAWFGYGFVQYKKDPPASKVTRIEGGNLYETSALISKAGWERSDYVVLSRGDRFQDALAGVPLAAKFNAPLLLSRNQRLDHYTKNELLRLQTKKVYILGGHLAIEPQVEGQIKQLGIEVERVAGANAHETAELISRKVAPNGSEKAIIVSDSRFQDALSVASYAGVRGIPILLANTSTLPNPTDRALKDLGVKETLVIGGVLAITDEVASQLPSYERIAGRTMFDTNIEAIDYFEPSTDKAYVATSERFPDGLSGAALAAKENAGVILVGNSVRDVTRNNLVNSDYGQVKVLGGELAINGNVFKEIQQLVD